MSAAATLPPENGNRVNWADDESEGNAGSRIEKHDEGDGVQTVVEYRRNADGKQVKVTRRIKRTLISTKVNHFVAERKNWHKFGLEKNAAPGPNSGTTSIGANVQVKLTAGATKEPEPDPTEAMREKLANKRVQCRLCKGCLLYTSPSPRDRG